MKNIRNFTKAMAITVTAAVAMTLTPVAMFAGFGGKANLFSHNVLASSVDDRTQQDFEDYYDYSSAFMSMHQSELPNDVRICLETARNSAYTALKNDSGIFEAMSNLRIQLSVAEAIYDGRQPDSNSAPLPVIGTAGYNRANGINTRAATTVASIYSTNRNLPADMIRTAVLNNFVDRMYTQIIGRPCDIQGRDAWVKGLSDGSTKPADVTEPESETTAATVPATEEVTKSYDEIIARSTPLATAPALSGNTASNINDEDYIKKLSAFSNRLYEMSAEGNNSNYTMSPISVYMALSLLYYSGDDDVKADIEKATGMTADDIKKTGALFKSLLNEQTTPRPTRR